MVRGVVEDFGRATLSLLCEHAVAAQPVALCVAPGMALLRCTEPFDVHDRDLFDRRESTATRDEVGFFSTLLESPVTERLPWGGAVRTALLGQVLLAGHAASAVK